MSENTKHTFIVMFIIITLSILVISPDSLILFSQTTIGKFVIVAIIVFYTCLDWVYGVFICLLILLLYQSNIYESITLH
jgi:uncharacterized membrane protein YGL010W